MNDRNQQRRILGCRILFFAIIAVSCVVFYIRIVPLVIYNMDDWNYLIPNRVPWPTWGSWNPTRVLPELLMPWTTQFSVWLIYPLTGHFIRSIETGMALVVSAMVTFYAFCFFRMTVKKAGEWRGMVLTVLFLVLHLLVFKTSTEGNDYLLAGYYDTTTFFFYLIPALLNGSLVMYFISSDYFRTRKSKPIGIRIIVLIAVYLSLFSNLYQSVILAAYAGIELLTQLLKKGQPIRERLTKCGYQFLILGLWIFALVFEYFGGRSQQIGVNSFSALGEQLGASGETLLNRLKDINILFVILLVLSLICFLLFLFDKKTDKETRGEKIREDFMLLAGTVIVLVYEWLLCGVSFSWYAKRGDVLICVFFFLFLFMLNQFRRLSAETKTAKAVLILVTAVCVLNLFIPSGTWLIRTNYRINADVARNITEDIVTVCKDADQSGKNDVGIPVPVFAGDNWPLSLGAAGNVPRTLYKYNQISRNIDVSFVPDPAKNEQYGISLP